MAHSAESPTYTPAAPSFHGSNRTRRQILPAATCALIASILVASALAPPAAAINAPPAADEPQAPPGEIRILPVEREKPIAASIRLKNGLVLNGMVSSASTLAPIPANGRAVDRIEQKLLLKLIYQGYREVYVPPRRSDPAVPDITAWPAQSFPITRPKQRREICPLILPQLSPFDELGVARGKITRSNGQSSDVTAAITSINELFATATSSTHNWEFNVSLDAIPRQFLPSTLALVEEFQTNPTRRLELVRMLMLADRLPEAGLLLQNFTTDFPQLNDRANPQLQQVREQLANRITTALEQRRDNGQHQTASNGARLHPKTDLTPETIVRVERLVREYDEINARIERLKQALPELAANLPDPQISAQAANAVRAALAELDPDSVGRMAAFELFQSQPPADRPTPDQQLAVALSGWLMGSDQTTDSLTETLQLIEARQLLLDYLATDPANPAELSSLADQLTQVTPLSVERAAALIQLLPSPLPIPLATTEPNVPAPFWITPTTNSLGALGLAPPEYHESRSWPLLIAFPQPGSNPEVWLQWWQAQAAINGYILVVPLVESPDAQNDDAWNASADQHRRFLNLLRQIKLGLRVDDDRVFIAGHGLGGDAAMDLFTSHPHNFAALATISSTGRKHLQWTAGNAIEKPWYIVLGDAHPLWFERMQLLAAKLFRRGDEIPVNFDVAFIKYPNRGAEAFFEEADDIFRWMALHRRQKFPAQIHAKLLRSTDLNWAWLQLDSIPPQFTQLDQPSTTDSDNFKPATLTARFSERNLIRITTSPANATILFSPEFPNFDPTRPIRIADGRKTRSIPFQPNLLHLLQHLHQTADRSRLCWQKI